MIEQSLNGVWNYRIGDGEWIERSVPFSALAVGHSECEKVFDLEYDSPCIELNFLGITYEATVLLNGKRLGKMLPYCEYRFDITDSVKKTGNVLRVILEDISPVFGPVAGWENFGGIIRDVYIKYRNCEKLTDVFFWSELENGYRDAVCNIKLQSENSSDCKYEIKITRFGKTVVQKLFDANTEHVSFKIENVDLWSPEEPNLYEMQTNLVKNGEIKDTRVEKIGFREIKCEKHRFLINGKPVFLRGVCKHEMVGDSGHTVAYDDILRDMKMIKDLGCNFVRLVHYPHGKAVLDIADEIGLFVSEEPGLWWSDTSNEEIACGSIEVLKKTISRDKNHPSVAFWLCFNECVFTEKFLIDSAKACKEADPTRLVSGANCMSDEDTLKYYEICGFDFYTMHPYSETFGRSMRSAKMLTDKPLVFTEWGGHFVYDNPKLMREFIHAMRDLYEKNSDDGALAGAFLWCFAEVNDYNRPRPAVLNGRLLEGLVDYERRPRLNYETFRTAWDETFDNEYKFNTVCDIPEKTAKFEYVRGGKPYADLKRELYEREKPSFIEEQRPRIIKYGPVCETIPTELMEGTPRVLSGDGALLYGGNGECDGLVILGGTGAASGYPLGGKYGEVVANVKVSFASGEEEIFPLRNGLEITTVYSTSRSSRINPVASRAKRFMEFSYDESFESYVMNKIELSFSKTQNVASVEIVSEIAGYELLFYAVFGYSK